jgi:hypothetical protein
MNSIANKQSNNLLFLILLLPDCQVGQTFRDLMNTANKPKCSLVTKSNTNKRHEGLLSAMTHSMTQATKSRGAKKTSSRRLSSSSSISVLPPPQQQQQQQQSPDTNITVNSFLEWLAIHRQMPPSAAAATSMESTTLVPSFPLVGNNPPHHSSQSSFHFPASVFQHPLPPELEPRPIHPNGLTTKTSSSATNTTTRSILQVPTATKSLSAVNILAKEEDKDGDDDEGLHHHAGC